jgi:high-affinity iron transporter
MLAAALIVFREVLEAGLIVGIVLAATRGLAGRGRMVAGGIAGGVLGALLLATFAGRIGALFAGSGAELFDAAVLIAAVVMLTWHTVWMARHGRALAQSLRAIGARVVAGERPPAALAVVVALAVLREGGEVVLFLYGVLAGSGASGLNVALGGALGLAAGAGVAALMYAGLLVIPLARLFTATGVLITLLAAGMAAQAVAFLQQGGLALVWQTPLWDTSEMLAENSIAGRLLHVLTGYTEQPNGLQLAVWTGTIAVISLLAQAVGSARPAPGGHSAIPRQRA